MPNPAVCWQCGASLAELTLPFSRFDVCRACHAELHACRMCRFYDVTVAKQCREPIAEEVRDKQRGNVCDYFSPRNDAYQPAPAAQQAQAKAALDALFGVTPAATVSQTDAQTKARAELEQLFGKKS